MKEKQGRFQFREDELDGEKARGGKWGEKGIRIKNRNGEERKGKQSIVQKGRLSHLVTCSTIAGDERDREQLRCFLSPSRDLEASYA
jgi:hypothetical protein